MPCIERYKRLWTKERKDEVKRELKRRAVILEKTPEA